MNGANGTGSGTAVYNHLTGLYDKKFPIVIDECTGYAHSTPQILSFEVTSKCNLRCIMCGFHSVHIKERKQGIHMPNELFEKSLGFAKGAELVALCGGGEPILKPDLSDMIGSMTELGTRTVITTNGVLLTPGKIEELVDSGLTYIEISVDGTGSYERIRGVPYDTLHGNLKDLSRIRKEKDSKTPVIDLSYTAMKDTLGELPDIVRLGAEIGAREIRVQPLQICFSALLDQNVYLNREGTLRQIEMAKKVAKELGIELKVRRLALLEDERYGNDEGTNELFQRYHCLEPFNSLMILADGGVQVCCAGIQLSKNLRDHDPEEIWNCEEMRELRLELMTGNFRKRCGECNLIHGSRHNQVIMRDKVTFSSLLRLERKALTIYREHLRKKGIIRGNIEAVKKLKDHIIGGET